MVWSVHDKLLDKLLVMLSLTNMTNQSILVYVTEDYVKVFSCMVSGVF